MAPGDALHAELAAHKEAGNAAFRAGSDREAFRRYTAGIARALQAGLVDLDAAEGWDATVQAWKQRGRRAGAGAGGNGAVCEPAAAAWPCRLRRQRPRLTPPAPHARPPAPRQLAATLYANRAAAGLRLGRHEQVVADSWRAQALMQLKGYSENGAWVRGWGWDGAARCGAARFCGTLRPSAPHGARPRLPTVAAHPHGADLLRCTAPGFRCRSGACGRAHAPGAVQAAGAARGRQRGHGQRAGRAARVQHAAGARRHNARARRARAWRVPPAAHQVGAAGVGRAGRPRCTRSSSGQAGADASTLVPPHCAPPHLCRWGQLGMHPDAGRLPPAPPKRCSAAVDGVVARVLSCRCVRPVHAAELACTYMLLLQLCLNVSAAPGAGRAPMKRVPTTASHARRLPKASLFMQCAAWGGRLWFFGGGEASEPRAASAASGVPALAAAGCRPRAANCCDPTVATTPTRLL